MIMLDFSRRQFISRAGALSGGFRAQAALASCRADSSRYQGHDLSCSALVVALGPGRTASRRRK